MSVHFKPSIIAVFLSLIVIACAGAQDTEPTPVVPTTTTVYDYKVVSKIPHDERAFTQGLFVHDGAFYETTGQYGASQLRRLNMQTGALEQKIDLPKSVFGEGATLVGDEVIALTWQAGRAFRFRRDGFEANGEISYQGEGWGLTGDGERLVMSDGSAELKFLNRDDFSVLETRSVTWRGRPVPQLNELEWINGEVFANIWQTDFIARIDPATGVVIGMIDLRGLLPDEERRERYTDVLNGIAWDAKAQRLFVTGKYWPWIYEIELIARKSAQ